MIEYVSKLNNILTTGHTIGPKNDIRVTLHVFLNDGRQTLIRTLRRVNVTLLDKSQIDHAYAMVKKLVSS